MGEMLSLHVRTQVQSTMQAICNKMRKLTCILGNST